MDGGNKRKKAELQAERERRAQLVIRNLQDAINAIISRLDELQRAVDKAQANEQAIRTLTERLNDLQQLLRKRRAEAAA
jgi:DNA repair ATPase RecN